MANTDPSAHPHLRLLAPIETGAEHAKGPWGRLHRAISGQKLPTFLNEHLGRDEAGVLLRLPTMFQRTTERIKSSTLTGLEGKVRITTVTALFGDDVDLTRLVVLSNEALLSQVTAYEVSLVEFTWNGVRGVWRRSSSPASEIPRVYARGAEVSWIDATGQRHARQPDEARKDGDVINNLAAIIRRSEPLGPENADTSIPHQSMHTAIGLGRTAVGG